MTALSVIALFAITLLITPIQGKAIRRRTSTTTTTPTPTDPKYADAWYLRGSIAPSINVECLWAEGITGKGVKVLILDDSFDFTNPELLSKEYSDASYNYLTGGKDVSPTLTSQWHGTPVAGILSATHNNDFCGAGVSPGVLVSGRVVIFEETTVEILIKGLSENLSSIDIIANSWGMESCEYDANGSCVGTYCSLIENVGIETPVRDFAVTGRGGKGGVVLFAAGDTGANTSSDTNINPATRIPYAITVGGVNSDLSYTKTSPKGKSLFITGPSANPDATAGIVGPLSAYNGTIIEHGCSTTLVGSGATAPIVAGVVALMLETKNTLTGDEVRQILMHSARKVDKAHASWVKNSAGVTHSIHYGFGYVDAAGAVEMTRKWSSCGSYAEQTVKVQTSNSSYYSSCLVNNNVELAPGASVMIPFFMKSLGSVVIDSVSVNIGGVTNASIEVALREDKRYCNTTIISKDVTSKDSTEQMPFTVIVDTKSNPSLTTETSDIVTLTTYQYAGMSSSGEWTLSIKNNGTTKLVMPLSAFSITARGFSSVIELSSPIANYENEVIKSITITPTLNDPGKASQDFGRGMRVYFWVDGKNPIPVNNSDGTALVVDVLSGDIIIPWSSSYNSLLSGTSQTELKHLRVILVDADEEYAPFTFSTCHTVISPIIVINIIVPDPEEETEVPIPPAEEEECPPVVVPEEEESSAEEGVPENPILPPEEEVPSDGFEIGSVGVAKLISVVSAFLIAMLM